MDQNNDHQIPDSTPVEPSPPKSSDESRAFPELFKDSQFSIKTSEEMVLRNLLRSGLVEAQGKDRNLIPLFVSWPHWLEDGIVCIPSVRGEEPAADQLLALLAAAGIKTFAQLGSADVAKLREILRAAGLQFSDPTTWPEQARLAAAGKMDELKKLQDSLKGGRRV